MDGFWAPVIVILFNNISSQSVLRVMNLLESGCASRTLLPLGWFHKSASHIAYVLKNLETFRKLCPSSIFRVHGYEVSNCRVHEVGYHLFLFDGILSVFYLNINDWKNLCCDFMELIKAFTCTSLCMTFDWLLIGL